MICSSQKYSEIEIQQLKSVLTDNGYPHHLIRRGIKEGEIITRRIIKTQQQQLMNSPNNTNNPQNPIQKKIFLTLPFHGHHSLMLSERITKICKKLIPNTQINIAFKKHSH
jgi:hypothetical protein